MKEFVIVPQSLIHDRELGDKRVIVFSAILFSGWNGNAIEDLVRYSGYSVCRDRAGVLQQYKLLVKQFIDRGYFKYDDQGIVYIKPQESFGIVYYNEFQRIMHRRDISSKVGKRMNHAHLLLVLAHIRLHMIHQTGCPEIYSNLLSRISDSTDLSVRSISSGLKILEELHIIHNEELPRYTDEEGRWHSNVRIFANMEFAGQPGMQRDWQNEIRRGITYILASQKF